MISLLRYFVCWMRNIRRRAVKPLLHGFLFRIFPTDAGPLFLGFAEDVFLVLYLLVYILKNVRVRLVIHASVYAHAAN